MAKITSSADFVATTDVTGGQFSDLGNSANVFIDTTNRNIYLDSYGALSDEGASLQALYSFLKEQ